jgi:hypothetical protein
LWLDNILKDSRLFKWQKSGFRVLVKRGAYFEGTHATKKLVARLSLAVPIGMLVEWTQLEVTRCLSLTYEFCGTSESPLNTIIHLN